MLLSRKLFSQAPGGSGTRGSVCLSFSISSRSQADPGAGSLALNWIPPADFRAFWVVLAFSRRLFGRGWWTCSLSLDLGLLGRQASSWTTEGKGGLDRGGFSWPC